MIFCFQGDTKSSDFGAATYAYSDSVRIHTRGTLRGFLILFVFGMRNASAPLHVFTAGRGGVDHLATKFTLAKSADTDERFTVTRAWN